MPTCSIPAESVMLHKTSTPPALGLLDCTWTTRSMETITRSVFFFTMTSRLGRNGCFVLSERMSFAIADATGDVLSLLYTWSLNTSLMPGLRVCTRHFGTTGHRTMSNPASIKQGLPSGSCFLSRRSGPTGQHCVPHVASAHGLTTCTRAQSATRLSGYWGKWLALLATVVFGKIGLKRIAAWRFLV